MCQRSVPSLLGAGGDLLREPTPLVDAAGDGVGEMRLSVLASQAATHLFGARGWAGEAIGLSVHACALDDPGMAVRNGRQMALAIEVDLMGVPPSETGLSTRAGAEAAR